MPRASITRQQAAVILNIAGNQGVSQAEVATWLGIEPIALVRMLDKLHEEGLVERRAHPTDRRIRTLWLTPAAEEMKEADWKFPDGRFLAYVLGPMEQGQAPIFIVLNAAPEEIAELSLRGRNEVVIGRIVQKGKVRFPIAVDDLTDNQRQCECLPAQFHRSGVRRPHGDVSILANLPIDCIFVAALVVAESRERVRDLLPHVPGDERQADHLDCFA